MYLSRQKRNQFAASEYRNAAEIQVVESTDDLDLTPIPDPPPAIDLSTAIYSRLPLEEQLQVPIRARSLVRNCLELEQVVGNQVCIHPPVYVAFGLIVKDRLIRTRRGFLNVIHPKVDLGKVAMTATQHADSGSGSPSKSAVASAKISAIANLVLATDVPGALGAGGASGSGAAPGDKGDAASGGVPGRRPLAETANAAAALHAPPQEHERVHVDPAVAGGRHQERKLR